MSTKNKNRYHYIVLLGIFLFTTYFSAYGQHFKFTPPNTRLVDQSRENPGTGLVVMHYKYQSRSNGDEILKFYRRLFSNQGYKELKPESEQRLAYFFSKQETGTLRSPVPIPISMPGMIGPWKSLPPVGTRSNSSASF